MLNRLLMIQACVSVCPLRRIQLGERGSLIFKREEAWGVQGWGRQVLQIQLPCKMRMTQAGFEEVGWETLGGSEQNLSWQTNDCLVNFAWTHVNCDVGWNSKIIYPESGTINEVWWWFVPRILCLSPFLENSFLSLCCAVLRASCGQEPQGGRQWG